MPCETAAGALRRKRIEIRRLRFLANSNPDGLFKRSGIRDAVKKSQLNAGCDGGGGDETNVNRNLNMNQEEVPNDDHHPLPPLLSSCSSSSSAGSSDELPTCSSVGRDGCPAYGIASFCGKRREMEDAVAVQADFSTLPCTLGGCSFCSGASPSPSSYHFFGVYDGHGGAQAATFCQARLHQVLGDEMQLLQKNESCPDDPAKFWEDAMTNSFLKVDEQVRSPGCSGDECENCDGNGCEVRVPGNVGSTAVVAVVGSDHIIVAHCGDCRAVLSRGGQPVQLSTEHKPSRPDEMARVEAAGGQVIFWDVPRVLGILAMSRSIGDQFMTPFLIPDPEVTCIPRSENDEFLILASDGLWDKVSNETACEVARSCISGRRARNGANRSASAQANSSSNSSSSPAASTTSETNSVSSLSASTSEASDSQQQQQQPQQQQQQQQPQQQQQQHQHQHEPASPCTTAASLLFKIAMRNGSKDNISVVVVDLKRPKEAAVVAPSVV